MAYHRWTTRVRIGFGVSTSVMVVGVGKVGQAVVGANAADGVAWTTVAGAQQLRINRGRLDELSKIEAGRSTLILDNQDGSFSPENVASQYYPNVVPNRRLDVVFTLNGVDYPLYSGFIVDWYPTPDAGLNNTVRVECVDYLDQMANLKLNRSFSQELSGTRVGHVMDSLQIVGALRDIDTGASSVAASTLANVTARQHIADVELVESGLFYISTSGVATFRDRHARITRARSNTSQATFGSSTIGFDAGSMLYEMSGRFIYNDVRVTRSGGVEQVATDVSSQTSYGRRSDVQSSALFVDDAQAASIAGWRLGLEKDPVGRIKQFTVTLNGDDATAAACLALEIGDRITVVSQFPSNFGMSKDFYVEGMRWQFTEGLNKGQLTLFASRADTAPYLIVGHATRGLVGTGWVGF